MEEEKIIVSEDETLEDLQLGGLRLIQKKRNFRYGMDSVLLADFARIRPDSRVADLGTGTGILLLLLAGRGKGESYVGLEIQPEMAALAEKNMRLNHLEDRSRILCLNVSEAQEELGSCTMDAVICNPPYGIPGRAILNPEAERSTARHQREDTLAGFFKTAFRALKGKGRLFLVYPAAQLFSLMTALREAHLEPKRFRLVYPDIRHGASLVLMEAMKDGRPTLQTMPPLIIRDEAGDLTNEMKSIYHMEQ